ncbi:DUF6011 domain-containing protein [Candidatus Merdisoma sp. JLR.KK006]|uniref:DUF6011 domain-containing protein n=1 Tax=Candidatus Merdisoma sp. JLR.KK006 TaxID=3112626 RepID=UPI002FEFE9C5
MRCLICGRKLRNLKSRELGYGPVCYKRKFDITPHIGHRDADTLAPARKVISHNLPGQMSIEDYLMTFLEQ